MVRTQIQLDEQSYRTLKQLAHERGVSLAELVRRSVQEYLSRIAAEPSTGELKRRALSVAGKYSDPCGATDVAERHDEYLWSGGEG